MARRHHHEEHLNHEAWAIPYADLLTLLLAFFVVMYAISSINEFKYRVVADALSSAFGGPPRTITPIQLGQTQLRGSTFDRPSLKAAMAKAGPTSASPPTTSMRQILDMPTVGRQPHPPETAAQTTQIVQAIQNVRDHQLNSLGEKIELALTELMRQKLVTVRHGRNFLEVEIQSDILFASGAAVPSAVATSTVRKLAAVLRESPNAVRVEGYTDDRPIRTAQLPSNWELSSARAASVVHVLVDEGVGAERLAVVGYGEHQPIAVNTTMAGRNANRRVLLVILAAPQGADAVPGPHPTTVLQDADKNPPVGTTTPPATSAPAARIRAGVAPSTHPAVTAPMTATVAARLAPIPGAG